MNEWHLDQAKREEVKSAKVNPEVNTVKQQCRITTHTFTTTTPNFLRDQKRSIQTEACQVISKCNQANDKKTFAREV